MIPLKIDSHQAQAALHALASEGARTGKDVSGGFDDATKGARTLGTAVTDIITHQGYQMLRDAAQAIGRGFQETAEYVRTVSKEFTTLQESLRIIATFKGEKLTDQFTVDEAMRAAEAGLTPQQGKAFQGQFQGFAGQFMGEGKKFSKAQGEALGQRAAAFMNVRGIEPSQGGAIFGEILQQATGEESTDELMEKFGKAYVMIEQAKGDPGPLLGQIGQVTAQGVDVLTGAKLMRAMAQRDPGDAGTHARAALRGLSSIRTEGKQGELGITDDMDVFKQLEAISKKAPAEGKDQEDFIRKYFKDEREFAGIMAGVNFGVRGGLFAAADKEAGGITGRTDISTVDEFRKGGPGARIYEQAGIAAERVKAGAGMSDVMLARLQAERQLTAEHRFEEMPSAREMILGNQPGLPSIHEQQISERAIQNAFKAAGRSPTFGESFAVGGSFGIGQAEAQANEIIKNLLHEQTAIMRQEAAKPLTAPPPKPETRPSSQG